MRKIIQTFILVLFVCTASAGTPRALRLIRSSGLSYKATDDYALIPINVMSEETGSNVVQIVTVQFAEQTLKRISTFTITSIAGSYRPAEMKPTVFTYLMLPDPENKIGFWTVVPMVDNEGAKFIVNFSANIPTLLTPKEMRECVEFVATRAVAWRTKIKAF